MPRGAVSVCSIPSLSRVARLQRLERRTKAREWGAPEARPDLAYAGFAVRDPSVEDRLDALRDNLARIDAEGRAAERECGDGEARMLGQGNGVHLESEAGGGVGRSTDIAGERRGRRHGKSAQAQGLCNLTVADHRVGVLGTITFEIAPVNGRQRCGAPTLW